MAPDTVITIDVKVEPPPDITGKWRMVMEPHDLPGVSIAFFILIDSVIDGIITGHLINPVNNAPIGDLSEGRLRKGVENTCFIMCFEVSLGMQIFYLGGAILGRSSPFKFDGAFIRQSGIRGEGERLLHEPGDTGTGGGSQTT